METEVGKSRSLGRKVLAPLVWLAWLAQGLLRPVWWTFPLVVGAISAAVPHLRTPIFEGWKRMPLPYEHSVELPSGFNLDSPYLWAAVLLQLIPLGIWLAANIVVVTNKDTPTTALQWDHFISVNVYGLMMIIMGALFAWHTLYWGYIAPALIVSLDAWFTGHFGLNNAAQKPGFGNPKDR